MPPTPSSPSKSPPQPHQELMASSFGERRFAHTTRARFLTLPCSDAAVGPRASSRPRAADYSQLASTSDLHLPASSEFTATTRTRYPDRARTADDRVLRHLGQEIDHLFFAPSPTPSPRPSPRVSPTQSPRRGPFVPRPLLLNGIASPLLPSSPQTPRSPVTPFTPSYCSSPMRAGYFDSTTSLLPPSASSLHRSTAEPHRLSGPARTSRPLPSSFRQRAQQGLYRQVDPQFLRQCLDPRELLFPVTTRKLIVWGLYASIGIGLFLAHRYGRLGDHVLDALRFNNFVLMGVIYGIEPIILMLLFVLGHYGPAAPPPSPSLSLAERRHRAKTHDTALVIPAHNSDPKGFEHMLVTALKSFAPENIFVVDNANCALPVGETQEITRRVDPHIQYMWVPLGNKNAAQYVGTLAVRQRGLHYVLVVDDDVLVPETFIAPTHLLDGNIKAACFPIQAVDKRGDKPSLIAWQDLEYKIAGFTKLAERSACGVLYPHGACSFWERDTLLQVLRRHDLIFFGEDLKLGLALMKSGKRLTIDDSQIFNTEAPETLFGPAPNFYQQRVRSWEMGRHILYKEFFQALLGRNGQTTLHGFSIQKLMQTYAIAGNLVDWMRVPLFAAMGGHASFWARSSLFTLLPIIPALTYKYAICRKRPELAPSLQTA